MQDDVRFWSKIDKSGDCWLWIGAKNPQGYGHFHLNGRTVRAHRHSYELAHGAIPSGMYVCHRCDRPDCVRPDHLYLGTNSDNQLDALQKGRATPTNNLSRARNDRLWSEVVRQFRQGEPKKAIARRCGIDPASVRYILRREGHDA